MTPAWRNLFENTLTVQFDHRMVAYAHLARVAMLHAVDAVARTGGAALDGALALAALVTRRPRSASSRCCIRRRCRWRCRTRSFAIVVFTVADRARRAAVASGGRCACAGAQYRRSRRHDRSRDRRGHRRAAHAARQGQRARYRVLRGARRALRRAARPTMPRPIVLTGAGQDVLRRCRSQASERRRRRITCARFLPALHQLYEDGVLPSEAGGRGDQRPCRSPAARSSPAAPTAASWRHEAAASASPNCWSACRFRRWPSRCCALAVPAAYLAEFAYSGATYMTDDALDARLDRRDRRAGGIARATRSPWPRSWRRLPPAAFAQTKAQIRGPVTERLAVSGEEIDREVTALWCADDTLARVRDYVARMLTK